MSDDRTGRVSPEQERGKLFFLHALGRDALPEVVEAAGQTFRVTTFIKHDFFAATGFYRSDQTGQKVVLKMSRTEPFLGLPMTWVGQLLNYREMRFYRRLSDIGCVPPIVGRVGKTGFLHGYVEGRPLQRGRAVPDDFFDRIAEIIDTLHDRGIAIVDTNKPENILIGDDGLPHLIDFQISYDIRDLGGIWPARAILRMFRRIDHYHILKHKLRLRPDLITASERRIVEKRCLLVQLHRTLAKPYFIIRRRLFTYLRDRGRLMPEGSK